MSAAGSIDDVALAQIDSVSKVRRIEHGRTAVRPGDVRELCRLYGVAEDTTETLAGLTRATRHPGWRERLATAPPRPGSRCTCASKPSPANAAPTSPVPVHGLFQTREYACEVERTAALTRTSSSPPGTSPPAWPARGRCSGAPLPWRCSSFSVRPRRAPRPDPPRSWPRSCAEMRRAGDAIEVRGSKDPHGPVLRFTPSDVAAWLDRARHAEFGCLLEG